MHWYPHGFLTGALKPRSGVCIWGGQMVYVYTIAPDTKAAPKRVGFKGKILIIQKYGDWKKVLHLHTLKGGVMEDYEKGVKETTRAYLAGHIDASSSVGIYKIKGLDIPMVRIRRRDPRMLEFIKKTWGGTLTSTPKAKELTLTHRQAWMFLMATKQWLLYKGEMANQIIAHYESVVKARAEEVIRKASE